MSEFNWHDGYRAFTVSATKMRKVREYILNQEVHHKKRSFKNEYVTLLRKSGVKFEEEHLW